MSNFIDMSKTTEHTYSDSDDMSSYSDDMSSYSDEENEDPTPKWNIPTWKGNTGSCNGCTQRISPDGEKRGCSECDEFWDLPDMYPYENVELETSEEQNCNGVAQYCEDTEQYCEGCILLSQNIGGENQFSHVCMNL